MSFMRNSSLAVLLLAARVRGAAADDPPAAPPAEPATASPAPPVEPPAVEAPKPTGTVVGKVLDQSTNEGLPAVSIQIKGGPDGDQMIASELDGTYRLTLAAGTYRLIFSTPDHIEQEKTVEVTDGAEVAMASIVLPLVPQMAKAETIEVYDTIDTRTASAVLAERRAAATVSDAVSAEQISRSPDSNASDAAKRMVAATIQDNRYIVVRGLGGRYSLTLLNGVPLPSPDPDVPAAPLDLFPASLITNLTVNKTFSPDMPGNFAGGALGIETRTYPTRLTFRAKLGAANNSMSSFRTLNGQQGGSLDILGFDDGSRAMPSAIPDTRLAGDPSLTQEQVNAQISGFKNNWTLDRGTAGPNLSAGATLGNTHRIGGQRLGYFTSLDFGHGYARRLSHIAKVGSDDPANPGEHLPSVMQLDDETGIEQANLGGIASAGWTPKSGHKIDLFTLYSHGTDISASQVTGTENNSSVVDRTRLQFLQRELMFGQLVGEHALSPRAVLEWQGNVSHVAQHEPDTRDLLRTQTPDGSYAISTSAGSSERLFGELADNTVGGGAALRIPLGNVRLKLGSSIQRGARDYQQRRFHFNLVGNAVFQDPDTAFDPNGAGTSMSMIEMTVPTDGYQATRLVASGFAMADINLTDELRVVGGARYEHSALEVGLASKIDLMVSPEAPTRHVDDDILPALNLVYALSPAMNLRGAYGMTVARPNFREIAPALYYDYVRRRAIGGNPNLEETTVHNADLRWEAFMGDSEVLAASVFAKHFARPIERTVEASGDGQNIAFANADAANSYGVELEARVSLGRLSEALRELSVGGNLSLIGSRIDTGMGKRTLQGQSRYVANVAVGYESRRLGTRIDILYNSFGRRIEEVGTGGEGNVYEEPFHRLDLAAWQPLSRGVRLKLAASNLLDQRVVRTQDDVEIFAYKAGVTVVGSVELSLE